MNEKNGYAFPKSVTLPIAVLAVFLGSMLVPLAAGAKTITKSRSAWIRGPVGKTKTISVSCPRGTEAISGGYRVTSHIIESGPTSALLTYSSRRVGKSRWRVSAYKVGPGKRAERLTALAYCQVRSAPIKVQVARSTLLAFGSEGNGDISGFGFGSVTASCLPGTRPISGGFQMSVNGSATPGDGPPVATIFGSRAVGRGWEVTAARLHRGVMRLKSFAYCGSDHLLRRSKTMRRKGDGRIHNVMTPSCPRRTSILSGGFYARVVMVKDPSGGTYAGATFPAASSLNPQRRWRVTGYPQGDVKSPLTSYVYCAAARKARGKHRR